MNAFISTYLKRSAMVAVQCFLTNPDNVNKKIRVGSADGYCIASFALRADRGSHYLRALADEDIDTLSIEIVDGMNVGEFNNTVVAFVNNYFYEFLPKNSDRFIVMYLEEDNDL